MASQGLTSADSGKPMGVATPNDALGEPKRMVAYDNSGQDAYDKPYKNPEWLREQYLTHKRSTHDIAGDFNISQGCIRYWLKKHDIDRRGFGALNNSQKSRFHDESWLREQYTDERKSVLEIARMCNASTTTVRGKMRDFGIEVRSTAEENLADARLKDAGLLRRWNHEEHLTLTEISERLNVTVGCISHWFDRHDIEVWHEAGERHPQWQGGTADYYGESWGRQRRKARKRDDNECVICGDDGLVDVHHIRPFREFGVEKHEAANRLSNLICLCRQHHNNWEGIPLRPEVIDE